MLRCRFFSGTVKRFCDQLNVYLCHRGICETGRDVAARIETLVPSLAKAYLELYKSTLSIREFFGLRDFYRSVKFMRHKIFICKEICVVGIS